jgi:hypothetical protein
VNAKLNKQGILTARIDCVVVGAGPAGLATSRELTRRGVDHLVLERGDRPGYVFARLYDSLVLHTGRHMSGLPGLSLPRSVPLFPPRQAFADYLVEYARHFALPVRTCIEVQRALRGEAEWMLSTSSGTIATRALVMATGIVSNPFRPDIAGLSSFPGRVLHSSAYKRPSDLLGPRILVVGVGNSGGEIASELGSSSGLQVDIAMRSGANVVPRDLFGIPIQYLARLVATLPRGVQETVARAVQWLSERRHGPPVLPRAAVHPLDGVPIIGFHLVDAIRAGRVGVRGGVDRIYGSRVTFADGSAEAYDTILLATGYRAAVAPLAGLVTLDRHGFALRTDRVASAEQPDLWFVGHNYNVTGALLNIDHDAKLAAGQVASALERVTQPV